MSTKRGVGRFEIALAKSVLTHCRQGSPTVWVDGKHAAPMTERILRVAYITPPQGFHTRLAERTRVDGESLDTQREWLVSDPTFVS